MRLVALILASLLLLPSTAAAKSGVVLDSTPQGYTVGEPWVVTVIAIRHDARVALPRTAQPAIRIDKQNTGETHTFAARRQHDRTHLARVVFPSSGVWTYSVIGIGRLGAHQGWEPVTIAPPQAASSGAPVSAVDGDGDGFPLAWIAAASPIVIALGLFILRRRAGRSRADRPATKPGHGV